MKAAEVVLGCLSFCGYTHDALGKLLTVTKDSDSFTRSFSPPIFSESKQEFPFVASMS